MTPAQRPGDRTLLWVGTVGLTYAIGGLLVVTAVNRQVVLGLLGAVAMVGLVLSLGRIMRGIAPTRRKTGRRLGGRRPQRSTARLAALSLLALACIACLVGCLEEMPGASAALCFSLGAQVLLVARRDLPGHGGPLVAALLAQALIAGATLPPAFGIPAMLLPIPLAVTAMAVLAARQARALPPALRRDPAALPEDRRLLAAWLGLGTLSLSIVLALVILALPAASPGAEESSPPAQPARPPSPPTTPAPVTTDPAAQSARLKPPPQQPAPAVTGEERSRFDRLLDLLADLLGEAEGVLFGLAHRIGRGLAGLGLADGMGNLSEAGQRALELTALGVLLQLFLIVWLLLSRRRRRALAFAGSTGGRRQLESYYYEQLLAALEARGLVRLPAETLLEHVTRAARSDRDAGALLLPLVFELYAARFGNRPLEDGSRRRLIEAVRVLQRPRQQAQSGVLPV